MSCITAIMANVTTLATLGVALLFSHVAGCTAAEEPPLDLETDEASLAPGAAVVMLSTSSSLSGLGAAAVQAGGTITTACLSGGPFTVAACGVGVVLVAGAVAVIYVNAQQAASLRQSGGTITVDPLRRQGVRVKTENLVSEDDYRLQIIARQANHIGPGIFERSSDKERWGFAYAYFECIGGGGGGVGCGRRVRLLLDCASKGGGGPGCYRKVVGVQEIPRIVACGFDGGESRCEGLETMKIEPLVNSKPNEHRYYEIMANASLTTDEVPKRNDLCYVTHLEHVNANSAAMEGGSSSGGIYGQERLFAPIDAQKYHFFGLAKKAEASSDIAFRHCVVVMAGSFDKCKFSQNHFTRYVPAALCEYNNKRPYSLLFSKFTGFSFGFEHVYYEQSGGKYDFNSAFHVWPKSRKRE